MGFKECSLFAKIQFVLLIIAFILQIIGLAVPLWYAFDLGIIEVSGGIWRYCSTIGDVKTCADVVSVDYLQATQAFAIMGMIALLVALVLVILYIFVMSDKKILSLIAFILCFCAFLFILISISVFAGESDLTKYHFAFALCIIAMVLALVAGILGVLDWMKK